MEQTPSRIGRYEIISLVGRGASGQVFKARDPVISRIVALKRFSISSLLPEDQKEEFKERFFREAQAAGNLKHPNIVTIHDVGLEEGIPFMAMEFVEGESLSKLMKSRGAVRLGEAASIVRQIAGGLHYAHQRGVVHRDIKPDNILMGQEGRVVITDFGAARLQTSELTRTGEVLGTPHYMSPEQVLGEPLDGRSDLFSLGVIFYLLLTGRRPFKGDTISSICYHIVHSPPDPVPEEAKIPGAALPILEKLLAKKREDRFCSGADLAQALNSLEPSSPGPTTFASTTQTLDISTPRPSRARVASIPGGTAPEAGNRPADVPHNARVESRNTKTLFWILAIGSLALLCILLIAGGAFVGYRYLGAGSGQGNLPAPPTPVPPVAPASSLPDAIKVLPTEPPSSHPEAPAPAKPPEVAAASPDLKPPPLPKRVSPQVPPIQPAEPQQPSAATVSDCYLIVREAEFATAAAQKNNFDEAYAKLDPLAGRIEALSKSVTPLERIVFQQAETKVKDAQRDVQQTLADWAGKVVSKARETFSKATEGINDDEEGIINSYVQIYPALRLKERLPAAMRQEIVEFGENCRENLDDDEWERAQSLATGKRGAQ